MAQDLKDIAPDIAADMDLLNNPNLSDDQLVQVIDRMLKRDPSLVQKATQTPAGLPVTTRGEKTSPTRLPVTIQGEKGVPIAIRGERRSGQIRQADSRPGGATLNLVSLWFRYGIILQESWGNGNTCWANPHSAALHSAW